MGLPWTMPGKSTLSALIGVVISGESKEVETSTACCVFLILLLGFSSSSFASPGLVGDLLRLSDERGLVSCMTRDISRAFSGLSDSSISVATLTSFRLSSVTFLFNVGPSC